MSNTVHFCIFFFHCICLQVAFQLTYKNFMNIFYWYNEFTTLQWINNMFETTILITICIKCVVFEEKVKYCCISRVLSIVDITSLRQANSKVSLSLPFHNLTDYTLNVSSYSLVLISGQKWRWCRKSDDCPLTKEKRWLNNNWSYLPEEQKCLYLRRVENCFREKKRKVHLFVKVPRPGDSEVIFSVFDFSCHLLLPV